MNKNKFKYHIAKSITATSAFFYSLSLIPTRIALADDISWIKDGGNGTFDAASKAIKETGASGYDLMMTIGVVGLVFSIMATGLSIAVKKNAQKKAENKEHLSSILIGGVVLFSALFLIGLIQKFAAGLK